MILLLGQMEKKNARKWNIFDTRRQRASPISSYLRRSISESPFPCCFEKGKRKKKKKMKVKIFVGDHVKELYETMYHEEDIKTYIGFCRCNAKKHSVVWYVHYIYGLLEDFVGPSSCIFKQSFFFFQYIVIARSNEIKSLEHLSEAIIDNDGLERIFLSK